ncbi:MAG: hypothetical protein K0S65_3559, partial [Labilithrix sp.]|nr:hypothetical protein [Labilithrix sp.]
RRVPLPPTARDRRVASSRGRRGHAVPRPRCQARGSPRSRSPRRPFRPDRSSRGTSRSGAGASGRTRSRGSSDGNSNDHRLGRRIRRAVAGEGRKTREPRARREAEGDRVREGLRPVRADKRAILSLTQRLSTARQLADTDAGPDLPPSPAPPCRSAPALAHRFRAPSARSPSSDRPCPRGAAQRGHRARRAAGATSAT